VVQRSRKRENPRGGTVLRCRRRAPRARGRECRALDAPGPGFRHGSCSWTPPHPPVALRSSSDAISARGVRRQVPVTAHSAVGLVLAEAGSRSAQGGRAGVSRLCGPQWRVLSYGLLFSRRACRSGLLSGVLGLVPFGSAGHTSARPRAGDLGALDASAVPASGIDTLADVGASGTPRRAAAESPPARNAVPIDSAPGVGEPPTFKPLATSLARTSEPIPQGTDVTAVRATSPVLRFTPNDQLGKPASVGFLRM